MRRKTNTNWLKKKSLNLLKGAKSPPTQDANPLFKYIKNLSNTELSKNEMRLLSKGLKFIPTPGKQKASDLIRALNELKKTMNLRIFFHNKTNKITPFHTKQV
jgi:hypothetical protein